MNGAMLALRPARRDDKRALHAQIADQIRAAIDSGARRPGDHLPPEAELAQQACVARLTVRQALDNLQREGLIERRHGIGTFVAQQAARTADVAWTTDSHAAAASRAAATVQAEAVTLRREARRLRAEMVALRQQLALLLADGARPSQKPARRLPSPRRAVRRRRPTLLSDAPAAGDARTGR